MNHVKNFCDIFHTIKNRNLFLFGVSGAGKSYLMNHYFEKLLSEDSNVFVINFSGFYKEYPIYLKSINSHIYEPSVKSTISIPDNINSFCLHARCGFSDSDHYDDISNLIFSDLLPSFASKRSIPSKPMIVFLDGCDSSMLFINNFLSVSSCSIVSSWIHDLDSQICSSFYNASSMQIFCGSYHENYNKYLYQLSDNVRKNIYKFTSKLDYLLLNEDIHFHIF